MLLNADLLHLDKSEINMHLLCNNGVIRKSLRKK